LVNHHGQRHNGHDLRHSLPLQVMAVPDSGFASRQSVAGS
jgi:hypothetical protein